MLGRLTTQQLTEIYALFPQQRSIVFADRRSKVLEGEPVAKDGDTGLSVDGTLQQHDLRLQVG